MPLAKDLGRGMVVDIEGAPCIVEKITVQSPSARGASTLYKIRARNLETRGKVDRTFKGSDVLGDVSFQRRPVQPLYSDASGWCFMDLESYEQFTLPLDDLEEEAPFLTESLEGLNSMVVDGRVIGLELPDVVEMPIEECSPGIKGESGTGRTKPATMSTGLVVQVPEYINPGENIRIDTRDRRFLSKGGA